MPTRTSTLQFLRKLATFVAGNAVVLWALDRGVLRAASVYKDGASIICESKREAVREGTLGPREGAVNVVILGDSRILAGAIPTRFDAEVGHGVYSANLALPALPTGAQLSVLRDLVARNGAPRYLIAYLRADSRRTNVLFDHYAVEGGSFAEILSHAVTRRDSAILAGYFNPIIRYDELVPQYIWDSLRRPAAIADRRAANSRVVAQMLDDRGYYYIAEQRKFPSGSLPDDFDGGPDSDDAETAYDEDPYVAAFFDFAASHGISVLLTEPPVRERAAPARETMPAHYHTILARYPNVHMARDGWQRKRYPNRLFSDVTHVNPQGAALFTSAMAGEFLETFATELERPALAR
jgi:hypothetical protein